MKTITIDMDCGALGEQDLVIGYEGNYKHGVEIKSVKLFTTSSELEPLIYSEELEQIGQAVMNKLQEIASAPRIDLMDIAKSILGKE